MSYMKRMATSMKLSSAVLLLVLLPDISMAQISCPITQITDTTGGDNINHSLSADGNRIVFVSTMDLIPGGNADGNLEIFLYDISSSSLTQITNTTSLLTNNRPSLNGNGTLIVFESNGDLVPGGNVDGNQEIFLYNASSSSFTQITSTAVQSNNFALISHDGNRIVFRSGNNFTGGNADGNPEIFLYDIPSSSFTQITNTTGGDIYTSSINADGTLVAFNTIRDLTGGNADGNDEIFLYRTSTSTTVQITSTTGGGNYAPSLNEAGTYMAFQSDRDLVPGENTDGNIEIFLYNIPAGSFTQITHTTALDNFSPSISADGTRIAFVSYNDITGGNPDLTAEVFLYDATLDAFDQVTDATGSWAFFDPAPSINSDGTHMAFRSYFNINGGNPDGTSGFGNAEIYLSLCSGQAASVMSVPSLSNWGLVFFCILAGLVSVACLRRAASV